MNSKIFLLIYFILGFSSINQAQEKEEKIYHFNYWIDVPVTIFGIAYNFYGQEKLRNAPRLTPVEYAHLSPNDINAFDRGAAKQDPAFANEAHNLSDIALRTVPLMPFLLGFDKSIRSEALNLSLMYLEMHSVNTLVYLASAQNIQRLRPFVYNENEIEERKSGIKTRDSFFSGHVSVVTASSFFLSKVYLDYHPEHKNKKWLFYSVSTLPALYTSYFRYKAGKHYPSDLIVGYLVGASIGILIPELHKSKFYNRLSISTMRSNNVVQTRVSMIF